MRDFIRIQLIECEKFYVYQSTYNICMTSTRFSPFKEIITYTFLQMHMIQIF